MTKTSHRVAILLSLIAFSFAANATPIGFVPSDQTDELGNQVLVDIVVTPDSLVLIGAFDFIVNFDDSILSVFDIVFGTSLGDGLFTSFQDSFDLGGGMLNLAEFSLVFDLTSLQGGSPFHLATISFDTLALGISNLSLTGNILDPFGGPPGFLGDEFGFLLSTQTSPGSITVVQPPVSVPEPSPAILLLTGLGAMLLMRRKKDLVNAGVNNLPRR